MHTQSCYAYFMHDTGAMACQNIAISVAKSKIMNPAEQTWAYQHSCYTVYVLFKVHLVSIAYSIVCMCGPLIKFFLV
jgi:hypothetical protein